MLVKKNGGQKEWLSKRMVVKKNGCQKCALIKQCCSKTVWLKQKSFVENLSKEKEETNCEMIMLIKTLWLRPFLILEDIYS